MASPMYSQLAGTGHPLAGQQRYSTPFRPPPGTQATLAQNMSATNRSGFNVGAYWGPEQQQQHEQERQQRLQASRQRLGDLQRQSWESMRSRYDSARPGSDERAVLGYRMNSGANYMNGGQPHQYNWSHLTAGPSGQSSQQQPIGGGPQQGNQPFWQPQQPAQPQSPWMPKTPALGKMRAY